MVRLYCQHRHTPRALPSRGRDSRWIRTHRTHLLRVVLLDIRNELEGKDNSAKHLYSSILAEVLTNKRKQQSVKLKPFL